MDETIPPLPQSWTDMSKIPIIPDFPNIPPCKKNHFSEEWLIEILPGMQSNLHHVSTIQPNNLKIIPNTHTEVTLEEDGSCPQVH